MKYLLDTNICIYVMQRRPASVAARFESLNRGDVGMSMITYAEIRAGIEKRPDSRKHNEMILDLFVQRVPYLPFDEAAAHAYGVLRAAVPDRRRNAMDRLIAAHALGIGATLVTNNENDFKDYPGLVVENWTRDS
ncbi:type II toxin-antitoxin system VapC family toxin [Thiocapsa sp. UBA6158]|jgi:tRNA(fMet)-specific endonuclease VapC|uniref:type II toxin-antitoxin system VapC family toxin n=1 Tax=Thiocapsa sp. UBA6158 TaxID=1947692 RepID=UPI0025DFA850|nr:type II toxin-antitoxin system VapC family toxin [Thiocapsa sp. UBA6158]